MRIRYFITLLILQSKLAIAQESDVVVVELFPQTTYQTIHNFGASDAWSTQFVGLWPLETKSEMAKILFSREFKENGSPEGIALSAWRFNIGGGTAEQGSKSGIIDEWRRTEGFLNADGTYDWNKQKGQQWFLEAAKKYDVDCLIGFVNSPPVHYTKNHKGYSSDGKSANLDAEHYNDYALFLKSVVQRFHDSLHIDIDYICPFNEPQWEWKGGQEGSPWNNWELANCTKVIDSVFLAHNIVSKLEITEAGAIDYLVSKKENSEQRSNQVDVFFNSESSNYIGDLKSLAPKFSGHSYFTTWDINKLKQEREKLAEKLEEYPDLEYWMSEYCVLENNKAIKGVGKDLGMKTALYVARLIHADITIAQASAWHWWLAMSPYNYKDGLIYHEKNKTGGHFQTSKLLWSLGNFSRFVRPGAKRIKVVYDNYNTVENLKHGVLISAYKNIDGTIAVVIINQGKENLSLQLKNDFRIKEVFVTNETDDLKRNKHALKENGVGLKPESIYTILL